MPVSRLNTSGVLNAMKSDEGNDSLDTFIRQAISKEPLVSFPRTADNPVQWIQLLHALDQPDIPGWPLLTPLKTQMQKCEKCSREFCSPINYRRHIRVHRRSLKVDKESHKIRDMLAAFWDTLSLEKAKEVVSFEGVSLKGVPGSSIIRALASSLRKPSVWTFPQAYVKAGSTLLDIIHSKLSRLPISSQDLFTILDDASEDTFLCAGTAESVQRYVFEGEPAKMSLELKNLVACTSFLFELLLIKAWVADKDAEALRCQKLLVEEEEAAQKRQAQLLERKKQKKIRQKEHKAREQVTLSKADLNVTAEVLEEALLEETSGPLSPSDSTSDTPDGSANIASSPEPPRKEIEEDIESQLDYIGNHVDLGNFQTVEPQLVAANGRRHSSSTRWQVPKSHRGSRNGFYGVHNVQALRSDPIAKSGASKERASLPNGSRVWTRKLKAAGDVESLRPGSERETRSCTEDDGCELMIGSISVTLRNCVAHQLDAECRDEVRGACCPEEAMPKKNSFADKLIKSEGIQSGASRSPAKHWRRVSRHETTGPSSDERGNDTSASGIMSEKIHDQTVPSESCMQSHGIHDDDDNNAKDHVTSSDADVEQAVSSFSSKAAKEFLAKRWREAISEDHVKLVLSYGPEPPGGCDNENNPSIVHENNTIVNGGNRHVDGGAVTTSATGNTQVKFRTKSEKSLKIKKYIPKQKAVA